MVSVPFGHSFEFIDTRIGTEVNRPCRNKAFILYINPVFHIFFRHQANFTRQLCCLQGSSVESAFYVSQQCPARRQCLNGAAKDI
jgi:hypothetical protein